jgi:hypothetical protein
MTMPEQPIAGNPVPRDEELASLERGMRRFELKHHILIKTLMSPAVAAAILGTTGVLYGHYILKQVEETKQENTLILEMLKGEDHTETLVKMKALVDAGVLHEPGKKLREILEEMKWGEGVNGKAVPPKP